MPLKNAFENLAVESKQLPDGHNVKTSSEYMFSESRSSLAIGEEIDTDWLDMSQVDKYQLEVDGSDILTLVVSSSSGPNGTGVASSVAAAPPLASWSASFPPRRRYVRYQIQNNTDAEVTDCALGVKATYGSSDKQTVQPVAFSPFDVSQAALVVAIGKAQQPDGDYVNAKADGNAYLYSTYGDDDVPTANQFLSTGWIDTDGYKEIELGVSTDQVGDMQVEFTANVQAETPQPVGQPISYAFDSAAIAAGKLVEKFGPDYDGVRISFRVGTTAPSFFVFSVELRNSPTALPQSAFTATIEAGERSVQTRGAIIAPNDADQFENIGRGGEGNGLNTFLVGSNVEIQTTTPDTYSNGQIAVGSNIPVQIPAPVGISTIRELSFVNPSDSIALYWGGAEVSDENGAVIMPLHEKTISINPNVRPYLILSGEGSGSTETINSSVVDSNTGVDTPSNMHTINSVVSSFGTTGDTATLSTFDTTSLTQDITGIRIHAVARKESGTAGEVVTFSSATNGPAAGYTNALNLTVSSIPFQQTSCYLVCVSRHDIAADVTNVTNTMGFSGFSVIADTGAAASTESRTTIILMTGTPTSVGNITVSFDTGFNYAAATVLVAANVDLTDPVTSFTTFASAGAGTYTGTLSDVEENGLFVAAIGTEITSFSSMTSPTGSTQRALTGTTTNNQQQLHVRTAPITSNGTLAIAGTLASSNDCAMVFVGLRPSEAQDPILVISHSNGSTTLPITVSSETLTHYYMDITGDIPVGWETTDISGSTLTPLATSIGSAAAEVDYVGYEVTQASGTVRIPYSWIGNS